MKYVLFICKRRSSYGVSYGLINSARFVANALDKLRGVKAEVIDVVDNNYIDREVHKRKPTHVIIEALWVVPSKFPILMRLHPNVKWYVRIHSKPEFIANEGIAFEWLGKYAEIQDLFKNLIVGTNNDEFSDTLAEVLSFNVVNMPNIYDVISRGTGTITRNKSVINIGCFGAVRPMKNHLVQALAAIKFAHHHNKFLMFHINSDRVEQRGHEVLKNLRALFASTARTRLVEHPWMPHDKFINLVRSMDIGMQVSMSETFNIIAADFISVNRPVVVCPDVFWMPSYAKANPNSIIDIERAIHRVLKIHSVLPFVRYLDKFWLWLNNRKALRSWIEVLAD